jgi:hypothetical protein
VDETLNKAHTQTMIYELTITKPGRDDRVLRFKVSIKNKIRRIDFLAPGDVKGMRFLALSHDQMYAFVPQQRKVRRLASHILAMGFMGSAFSHNEMALMDYAELYDGKLLSEDEKTWSVAATVKKDVQTAYPRLELKVRKDVKQPEEISYFNEKGVKIKVEGRSDYKCEDGVCTALAFKMKSLVNPDEVSTLVNKEWKVGMDLKDSFFTVRALERR